jgi:DNA-binding MarR family transcriptional regulator
MATDLETSPAIIDPLTPFLGYQLRRASAVMFADLGRSLAPLGLRPADASVLLLIRANRDITQSEIGKVLAIQRANMAPLAAALADKGLIRREQINGRSLGLAITVDGAAMCDQILATIVEHEKRYTARLPKTAYDRLAADLQSIWS